jgi:hypothetical protein
MHTYATTMMPIQQVNYSRAEIELWYQGPRCTRMNPNTYRTAIARTRQALDRMMLAREATQHAIVESRRSLRQTRALLNLLLAHQNHDRPTNQSAYQLPPQLPAATTFVNLGGSGDVIQKIAGPQW